MDLAEARTQNLQSLQISKGQDFAISQKKSRFYEALKLT